MKLFPVNLNVDGRRVLVVGGGTVALRKVRSLKECGAKVTVVSPKFCAPLARMRSIRRVKRRYRASDLKGMVLVIGATDCEATNRKVHADAAAGIPVNIVDVPDLCTFTVPSVIRKGQLMVTVSTGGGSPALSRQVRRAIDSSLDPTYADQLDLLRKLRPRVQAAGLSEAKRMALLKRMAGPETRRLLKTKGRKATQAHLLSLLKKACGKGR